MYHILIVDDEFLVRLGLKTTIDWGAHGYQVVGEAANGKEALDMVQTLHPDIVLVDIQMPLLDGIQFITEAKKTNRNISFIILSNHESFQYAQEAIKLGVSQYILKSEINAETLLLALKTAQSERSFEKERGQGFEQKRKTYLTGVLSKAPVNTYISEEQMDAPEEGLFPEQYYVGVKFFCNVSLVNEQSVNMLGKMIISLAEDEFSNMIYCETNYQMHYFMTLIFSTDSRPSIEQVLGRCASFGRKLRYYFSVVLKGGISLVKGGNIPKLLSQMELARQQCFFGQENFVEYEERFLELLDNDMICHVSSTKIWRYLADGDKEEMHNYIHDIFKELRAGNSYSCVHHTFIDFLSIAKSGLEKMKIENGKNIKNKLDYDNWSHLGSVDETESYICDLFISIITGKYDLSSEYSASVRKAIAYMEEFYASNITLEDIASHVEISKSYLSMLFKQETGINLVAFLNQYRIGRGKKLLATTNLKIYEIADVIGFGSPYYFSKVFKAMTGMQCKEYRDTFLEVN